MRNDVTPMERTADSSSRPCVGLLLVAGFRKGEKRHKEAIVGRPLARQQPVTSRLPSGAKGTREV